MTSATLEVAELVEDRGTGRKRDQNAQAAGMLPIGLLKGRDSHLPASYCLRVVPEGNADVRMTSELGNKANFYSLRLQGAYEGVTSAVGGYDRQSQRQ